MEYYTEEDYQEIIDYAQEHYITVVPEIDVPGHTNAATASYGELRCDGEPTDFYTGASVGFSAVCTTKEFTYELLDDVIRELAEMTPGPYIHIGGDEADETSQEEYNQFISRVLDTVLSYDKTPMGWQQSPATDGILAADPPDETVIQYYADPRDEPTVIEAIQDGGHDIVLSPHSLAYPDYEYNENTDMGSTFSGRTSVENAYSWNPGSYLMDIDESTVLGVEGSLWSDDVETTPIMEYAAFPRMASYAEINWSPWDSIHDWEDFRLRLATQGPRWNALGVHFYRSPLVPWPSSLPDTYWETYYEVVSVLDEPLPFTIESDDSDSESFNPNDYSSDRLIRSAQGSSEGSDER